MNLQNVQSIMQHPQYNQQQVRQNVQQRPSHGAELIVRLPKQQPKPHKKEELVVVKEEEAIFYKSDNSSSSSSSDSDNEVGKCHKKRKVKRHHKRRNSCDCGFKLSKGCELCNSSCCDYDINPLCNYVGITGLISNNQCMQYDERYGGNGRCIGCDNHCKKNDYCPFSGGSVYGHGSFQPGWH